METNKHSPRKAAEPKSTPIDAALPKEIGDKYAVRKKVEGTSPAKAKAGRYAKQDKIRPTFGGVHTVTH